MTTVIVPDAVPAEEAPVVPVVTPETVVAEGETRIALEEVIQEGETARAEIRAETEAAAIEAAAVVATAVTREELDECRRNIETMGQTLETISAQVRLISETLVEEETEEEAPLPNPNENPESEREGHPAPKTPEAESPPEPVKKKPAIRWT